MVRVRVKVQLGLGFGARESLIADCRQGISGFGCRERIHDDLFYQQYDRIERCII